jgi:hypothetical protein
VLLRNVYEIDGKVREQRRPILVSWHEQLQIIIYTDERNVTSGEASARSVLTSYLLSKSYILQQEKYFEASGKKS